MNPPLHLVALFPRLEEQTGAAVVLPAAGIAVVDGRGAARLVRGQVHPPHVFGPRPVGGPGARTVDRQIGRHLRVREIHPLERRHLAPVRLAGRGLQRLELIGLTIGLPLARELLHVVELHRACGLVGDAVGGSEESRVELGRLSGRLRNEAGNELARVRIGVGRVEPQLVLEDGTAQLSLHVRIVRVLVAGRREPAIEQVL